MSDDHKPVQLPEGKEHLDFLTSIVLFIISIAVIILSLGYWKASNAVFYASPGFMPILIAVGLALMSAIQFFNSLKGSSIAERWAQVTYAIPAGLRSPKVWRAAGGLAIFGIYIFVLLGRLPFWLASFLALFASLLYLNWKKEVKAVLKLAVIAVLSIAGIVLLFQVMFSVPMP